MPKIRSWWEEPEKTREQMMTDNYGKQEKKRNEDKKKVGETEESQSGQVWRKKSLKERIERGREGQVCT